MREGRQKILHGSGSFGLDLEGVPRRHGGEHSIAQVWRQEWLQCHPQVIGRTLRAECRRTGGQAAVCVMVKGMGSRFWGQALAPSFANHMNWL